MKKNIMPIVKLAAVLMASLFLTSCVGDGKENDDENVDDNMTEQLVTHNTALTPDLDEDGKRHLTLTGYLDPNLPEYSFMYNAVRLYMEEHPDVVIIVDNHAASPDYREYIIEFPVLMMSGEVGDIIMPPGNFSSGKTASDYFLDLYPFMENDSDFNPDDYFMNVIEANEANGKLYGLCTTFAIQNIHMLRSDISDNLNAAFLSDNCITYNDAVRLFIDAYDPENRHMRYFTATFQPMTFVALNYDNLVDVGKREAYFTDPGFIDLLKKVKEMPVRTDGIKYYPEYYTVSAMGYDWKGYDWISPFTDIQDGAMMALLTAYATPTVTAALYPYPGKYYTIPKVLATAGGNYTFAANTEFAINKNCEDAGLAWDFLKFMLEERAGYDSLVPTEYKDMGEESAAQRRYIERLYLSADYYYPVNRNDFEKYWKNQAEDLFEVINSTEYKSNVSLEEYTSIVLDFYTQAAERCSAKEGASSPEVNIWEEMYLYLIDSQSAEITMANIQNKVEAWLNE